MHIMLEVNCLLFITVLINMQVSILKIDANKCCMPGIFYKLCETRVLPE